MNHLTNEQLQDLFDDVGLEAASRDAHVASCVECRRTLDRLAALTERLYALPRDARSIPPFQVERKKSPWMRRMIQIAAALAIFALGFTAGRRQEIASPVSSDPIVEMQRTGTEYAAAIANARTQRDGAAYEVARSTLYGAATEVARLAPEQSEVRLTAAALAPRIKNVGF